MALLVERQHFGEHRFAELAGIGLVEVDGHALADAFIGRAWIVVGLWYLFGPLWESGRGSAALTTKPGSELVTGVADDAELLGDLDGRSAAAGVARVHRSVDGEDLAHLRR